MLWLYADACITDREACTLVRDLNGQFHFSTYVGIHNSIINQVEDSLDEAGLIPQNHNGSLAIHLHSDTSFDCQWLNCCSNVSSQQVQSYRTPFEQGVPLVCPCQRQQVTDEMP